MKYSSEQSSKGDVQSLSYSNPKVKKFNPKKFSRDSYIYQQRRERVLKNHLKHSNSTKRFQKKAAVKKEKKLIISIKSGGKNTEMSNVIEESEIYLVEQSPKPITKSDVSKTPKKNPQPSLKKEKNFPQKGEAKMKKKLSTSNTKIARHRHSRTQIYRCSSKERIATMESDLDDCRSIEEEPFDTVSPRPKEIIGSGKKIKPSAFLLKNRRSKSKMKQTKEKLKKFFRLHEEQSRSRGRSEKQNNSKKIYHKEVESVSQSNFYQRKSDPEIRKPNFFNPNKIKRVLKLKKREQKEREEKEREKEISMEIGKLKRKKGKSKEKDNPREKSCSSFKSNDMIKIKKSRSKTLESEVQQSVKKEELHNIIYKLTHPSHRVLSKSKERQKSSNDIFSSNDNSSFQQSKFRKKLSEEVLGSHKLKSILSMSKDSLKESPIRLQIDLTEAKRKAKLSSRLNNLKTNSHSSGMLSTRLRPKHEKSMGNINSAAFKKISRYSAKMKHSSRERFLREKSMGLFNGSGIDSKGIDNPTNYTQVLDWNVSLIKTNSKIRKENKELRTIIQSINKMLDTQLPDNESKGPNDVLLNVTKVLAQYSNLKVELDSQKNYISKIEEELRRMKALSHYYPISSEYIIQEIGMSVEETERSTSKGEFSRSQNLNDFIEQENIGALNKSSVSNSNHNFGLHVTNSQENLNSEFLNISNAFKKSAKKLMNSASPNDRNYRRSVSRQKLRNQDNKNFINEIQEFKSDQVENPMLKNTGPNNRDVLKAISNVSKFCEKENSIFIDRSIQFSPQFNNKKRKGEGLQSHESQKIYHSKMICESPEKKYSEETKPKSSRRDFVRETYPPLVINQFKQNPSLDQEHSNKEKSIFVGFGVQEIEDNLIKKSVKAKPDRPKKMSNRRSDGQNTSNNSIYSSSFIDRNIENLKEFAIMKNLDEDIKSYIDFVLKILRKECQKLLENDKENTNNLLDMKSNLEKYEEKYNKLKVSF